VLPCVAEESVTVVLGIGFYSACVDKLRIS